MGALYLSRLKLRAMSREVQRDLANCDNMHRRLLMAFPDHPEIEHARQHYGALYRIESTREGVDVLVQSRAAPDWSRLPAGYLREPAAPKRVDTLYDTLATGQTLLFRLRANPTKRISDRGQTQPERWRGKRVELRTEADQMAWLQRKGEAAGFAPLTVRVERDDGAPLEVPDVRTLHSADRVTGGRNARRLAFGSIVFEGRLRVTDVQAFRQALETGIGSGKAFGFGLLSVAPVPATG
jgi:CRISPR system Cascade subunit CasE